MTNTTKTIKADDVSFSRSVKSDGISQIDIRINGDDVRSLAIIHGHYSEDTGKLGAYQILLHDVGANSFSHWVNRDDFSSWQSALKHAKQIATQMLTNFTIDAAGDLHKVEGADVPEDVEPIIGAAKSTADICAEMDLEAQRRHARLHGDDEDAHEASKGYRVNWQTGERIFDASEDAPVSVECTTVKLDVDIIVADTNGKAWAAAGTPFNWSGAFKVPAIGDKVSLNETFNRGTVTVTGFVVSDGWLGFVVDGEPAATAGLFFGRDIISVQPAPANVVSFGKGERCEPDHADSGISFDVLLDGQQVGEIVSYKDNFGTLLVKQFKTVSYTLTLWCRGTFDVEDVSVEVCYFTSARKALSAIKQIARDRLAAMHGDDDAAKLALLTHGESIPVAFPDATGVAAPISVQHNVTGQHLFCLGCAEYLSHGEGAFSDCTVLRSGFVCCNCGTRTDNQTDADAEAELQQARDEWSAINGEVSDFKFRMVMREAAREVLHVSEPLINSWRRACAAKHAVAMAKAGQPDNTPDGDGSGKPFKMSDREVKTQTAEESVKADPFWQSSADALDVPADAPDVEPTGMTVSNVQPSRSVVFAGCVDADVSFNGQHVCSVTLAPDAVTGQLSILNGLEWHVDNIEALQLIAESQAADVHWSAVEGRLTDKYGADGFDACDVESEIADDHQPYYFNALLDDIVEAVTVKLEATPAKPAVKMVKTYSEACADVQGQLIGSLDADDFTTLQSADRAAKIHQAVELALLDTINGTVCSIDDLTSDVTGFSITQRDAYLDALTAHASKRSEAHLAAVICLVLDADKAVLMPPSKLTRLLQACLPGWTAGVFKSRDHEETPAPVGFQVRQAVDRDTLQCADTAMVIQPAKLDAGDRSFVLTFERSREPWQTSAHASEAATLAAIQGLNTSGEWHCVGTDNTVHRFKVCFDGSADIAADIAGAWHATAEAAQDKADEAQGAADFIKTGNLPDNWSARSDAYQEGWRAAEDEAADFKDWQDNVVGPSEQQRASEAMSDKIAMYQNEY